MTIKEFCTKYGFKYDKVYMFLYTHREYKYKIKNIVHIKADKLLKQRDEKLRLWNECIELYYELRENYKSDRQFAKDLAKFGDKSFEYWNTFLYYRLFKRPENLFKINSHKELPLFKKRAKQMLKKDK